MAVTTMLGCLLTIELAAGQDPEATSLLGKPLFPTKLSEVAQKTYEANLAEAKKDWEADPKSVDKYVWVGRRIAYLGRFREAIDWFAKGLKKGLVGTNVRPKLLRHLGHRQISIRRFDEAVKTLVEAQILARREADEVEPDGLPNTQNTPIGTVHSNIEYHLGLAYFLQGNYSEALKVYESAHRSALRPQDAPAVKGAADRWVSLGYWQALCYALLSQKPKLSDLLGAVSADLDVIENQTYHRLLLCFKGEIAESKLLAESTSGNDAVTAGYGIAAWRIANGRVEEGRALLDSVLKNKAVFAFGYIAAEAHRKRLATDEEP